MKERLIYKTPQIEIEEFETEDVIIASGIGGGDEDLGTRSYVESILREW